jgi:hypothetical protein
VRAPAWLIIAGVLVWVLAANVDRIVNGGDALGIALIVAGVLLAYTRSLRARDEQ